MKWIVFSALSSTVWNHLHRHERVCKYAHENLTRKCIIEELDGAPNFLGECYVIHSVFVDLTLFMDSDFCISHMSFFFSEANCDPPTIANSHYIPDRTSYRLGHVITYQCKNGFYHSTRGSTSQCTTTGWEPPPRCTCKFQPSTSWPDPNSAVTCAEHQQMGAEWAPCLPYWECNAGDAEAFLAFQCSHSKWRSKWHIS